MWWASILRMISSILNLLRFALWPCTNSWLILEKVTYLLEENTYFSILGGGFCKCLLSLVGSDGFSSLHFPVHPHLAVLSIIESWRVLRSPILICFPSILSGLLHIFGSSTVRCMHIYNHIFLMDSLFFILECPTLPLFKNN